MPETKGLHAYLTLESHRALQAFADENGVTLTGLMEALGLQVLAELKEAAGSSIRQDWVRAGRAVDARRRRRGTR